MDLLETLAQIARSLDHADECFELDERRYGFGYLGQARRELKAVLRALNNIDTRPE